MNGKTLYRETSYFRAFPEPKAVFANRVKKHTTYLLPVATLSLRHISRKWDGEIHFIMPIEPSGGYGVAGDDTTAYHNFLCRPNWIGYQLLGNKCKLACDFRFFREAYYTANPPRTEAARLEAEELSSHYRRTREEFSRRFQFFKDQGWLCRWPEEWKGAKQDIELLRVSLVCNLGGDSWGGNWANRGDFPISRYSAVRDGHDAYKANPQTEDGRDFRFIGSMEMWNYLGETNGILLLFYDPKENVALTTIDWT